MKSNSIFKLFYGVGIALLFIILGTYLIQKEDKWSVYFGYTNIIFFSGIILFTIIKLLLKKNSK